MNSLSYSSAPPPEIIWEELDDKIVITIPPEPFLSSVLKIVMIAGAGILALDLIGMISFGMKNGFQPVLRIIQHWDRIPKNLWFALFRINGTFFGLACAAGIFTRLGANSIVLEVTADRHLRRLFKPGSSDTFWDLADDQIQEIRTRGRMMKIRTLKVWKLIEARRSNVRWLADALRRTLQLTDARP